jgi:hypothetical protein
MQAITSISQGWAMAGENADGSRATAAQRAYNFAANGGGTVTFRMVVPILLLAISGLVGLMWNDLRDGQRDVVKSVTDQGLSIIANKTRIDSMQTGQQRIWTKLGAHDEVIGEIGNRVTRLESCQPNCAPR